MSANSAPISPERFAEAIVDLPLANLYFKADEIRNSIAHLDSSNQQLRQYAEEGDTDCAEALEENVETIRRMRERLSLLRREVVGRGSMWTEDGPNVTCGSDSDAAGSLRIANTEHSNSQEGSRSNANNNVVTDGNRNINGDTNDDEDNGLHL